MRRQIQNSIQLIIDLFRLPTGLPEDEGLDLLIGIALTSLFLGLIILGLWPLDRTMMALRLAKGYGIFWVLTAATCQVLHLIQRVFRIDVDTHFDAYVISNLGGCVFLLAGWSAFAALTVRSFVVGAPIWIAVILYSVAFISSWVAFTVMSSFYTGRIYKIPNLIAAHASFVVFAVWPASGHLIYGWFFDLFLRK